jgi:hypothetical protein
VSVLDPTFGEIVDPGDEAPSDRAGITELLAEIDALDATATPAPWKWEAAENERDAYAALRGADDRNVLPTTVGLGNIMPRPTDDALIVALRNAWPRLRHAIRVLQAPPVLVRFPELPPEEREHLREKLAQLGAVGVMPLGEPFEITDDRHDLAERLADAEQRADQVSEERAALAEQLDVAEREVKRLRRQLGGARKRRSAKKARKRWSR